MDWKQSIRSPILGAPRFSLPTIEETPTMDTKPIQINRRSANIVEGKSRAPNRSMFYAMGYEEGDFKKPMVGVANGHSTKATIGAGNGGCPAGTLLQTAAWRRFCPPLVMCQGCPPISTAIRR